LPVVQNKFRSSQFTRGDTRESGVSRTPCSLDLIPDVSGYWITAFAGDDDG
jgi:hypothetical protein